MSKRPSNDNRRFAKRQKGQQSQSQSHLHLNLREIEPKTDNQALAFDIYDEDKNLVMFGSAGTGKTFLALDMALEDVLKYEYYRKVVIVRSAVPSRNQGFLPGNLNDKSAAYESPYIEVVNELFGRSDAYQILKQKGYIEFITTSYLRGITLDNAVVIFDEAQNTDFEELNTVLTRIGENSRLIVMGDVRQTDLQRQRETSGFKKFLDIARSMTTFGAVEFTRDDIVRSEFVKSWVIASEDYQDRQYAIAA